MNNIFKGRYPDVSAFCLFFLSSLNSSNFKSIRLRSLTAFFAPLELILLMSMLCPSQADIKVVKMRKIPVWRLSSRPFFMAATSSRTFSSATCALRVLSARLDDWDWRASWHFV
jgi:hypothetical protein